MEVKDLEDVWECPACGERYSKIPETHKCSCGLFIASESTFDKYDILKEICEINSYDLIVEACAGSGIAGFEEKIIDGSPIRLAQIAKKKENKCIFIESDEKSYDLLYFNLEKRDLLKPSFEFILGDCNEYLPEKIGNSSSTLIFLDPFGYGNPPLRRDIIVELSKKKNVDLLFNFFWRICRQMGFARRYINDPPKSRHRLTAESFKASLDIYWGGSQWIDWGRLNTYQYARKYAEGLGNKKPQIFGLPQQSRENQYFLIFSTNQNHLKLGLDKYLL